MAGASLLALLDDIATLLDDVAVMTKVAVKKTAGVLGDDLALNAEQVAGVHANRELPVIWAVAKGSLINKAILVPTALVVSAFIPWAVWPLLMCGGLYLCLEGAEKLAHRWLTKSHNGAIHHASKSDGLVPAHFNAAVFEAAKIKGAVRTDFILSAEIIIIALGTVADHRFLTQVVVLVSVGFFMTVGVYGVVAGIVKLDDLGVFFLAKKRLWYRAFGKALVLLAPLIMKVLTIVGTAAMFLVGGGILTHGLHPIHHRIQRAAESSGSLEGAVVWVLQGGVGLLSGFLILGVIRSIRKLRS